MTEPEGEPLLVVEDLRRRVDDLSIKSPVDGIVGDLLVDQKAAVARDMPVMAVVDLSRYEIDLMSPESYAHDLATGMTAEVQSGGRNYQARIVAVSPEIVNNQVASRVRFVGDGPTGLRQNQRLTTRILIEEKPGVLTLQRGQFLESGGGRIAYVLDGDGLAIRKPIEIGARSLSAVEVAAGLAEGDRVAQGAGHPSLASAAARTWASPAPWSAPRRWPATWSRVCSTWASPASG